MQGERMRPIVTVLKSAQVTHTAMELVRLQLPVIFDVRQQSAVIISRASAMPVRSAWRAETPVSVRRRNAQLSVVDA